MAAQMLVRTSELPDQKRYQLARTILSSAERMTRIIGDLLDFTRVRMGGGMPMTVQWINAYEICKKVVDEFRIPHPDRHFTVSVEGDLSVCWDPSRISQVLSNLIGNAIDHGDPAGPITVSVRGRDSDVRLSVHNTGPAIDPAFQAEIFNPFRRGEQAREGKDTSGLGLGLYIAYQIAVGHGGTIQVHSDDENGTTFTVELPRMVAGCDPLVA